MVTLKVSAPSVGWDLNRQVAAARPRLRDFPEVRLDSRRTIDTGNIDANQAWTFGPELGLRWKNLLAHGEFSFSAGKEGGWGSWEVSTRYSYIDLSDENIEGG